MSAHSAVSKPMTTADIAAMRVAENLKLM